MITINLEAKDVKQDKTDSGRLIDKIAMAVGESTENDVFENSLDGETEQTNYCFDNFDFEEALIERLNDSGTVSNTHFEEFNSQPLKAGAFLALKYPEEFKQKLEDYKDECEELKYDTEGLAMINPELAADIEKSKESFWDDMMHEWKYGDHRDWNGIYWIFEHKIQADDVTAVKGDDEDLMISWDEDGARAFYESETGEDAPEKIEADELKRLLIEFITINMNHEANRRKAEVEARREKWNKDQEYKKERERREEEARIEKLSTTAPRPNTVRNPRDHNLARSTSRFCFPL